MKCHDFPEPRVLLFNTKGRNIWTRLRYEKIGPPFPMICQLVLATDANVLYENKVTWLQQSRVPYFKVIVPSEHCADQVTHL